jgi:hypothetical protein
VDDINSAARRRWDDVRSDADADADADPTAKRGDDAVRSEWNDVVEILVLSSVFTPPIDEETTQTVRLPESNTTTSSLSYHPTSRAFTYLVTTTLLIPRTLIPSAEHRLSTSLFHTLRVATAGDPHHDDATAAAAATAAAQHQIESTRAASSSGWGGPLGLNIATTLGVTLGGLALGLTGGLAAPAIAALAPGFLVALVGGAATAPVVLGSVFGIAGGGLAGRRVRSRWSGVGEFGFVDVKRGEWGGREMEGEREGEREGEGEGEKWAYEPRRKKVVPRQDEDDTASIITASTTTTTTTDIQANPPDKPDLDVEPGRTATESIDAGQARTEGQQQPPPPSPPPTDKEESQRSSSTDVGNHVDLNKGDASMTAAAAAPGTTAEIEQRTKTLNLQEEAGVDVVEGRAATTQGKGSEDKAERVPSLVVSVLSFFWGAFFVEPSSPAC